MPIDGAHGDPSAGKTKALERLAGQIYEQTGKKTRVYIGDGGAETYNDRGLVDDGVIEIMDFSFRPYPMTVLKLMTDFWFPADPADPESKLLAPDLQTLYRDYGLIIYEGGTVIGNWLLSDVPGGLAWHAAHGTGFVGVKDEEGELTYEDAMKDVPQDYRLQGTTSGKHYYKAQRDILRAIRASKRFPGFVWWTFHSTESADKTAGGTVGPYGAITGKKIIGPDAGGKALASTLPKEFGNFFHFDQALKAVKQVDPTTKKPITQLEREFRLYTRRHFDPNQDVLVEYVATTRVSGAHDYYVSQTPGDALLQFYAHAADLRRQRRTHP